MKKTPLLAGIALLLGADAGITADVIEEIDGVVAIEVEDTTSRLGKWKKKTDLEDYSGSGYLEFTGNKPTNGPPASPLEYRFRIDRGGLYFLHLRCAREKVKGRNDLANDAYIRVEGEFGPGPNPGDKHGDDAPLAMLRKDTKFFGGDDKKFVWASGNRLDPGGHNNKRVAVYAFKPGEVYTVVVSGRSQLFKLDRLVFRHEDVAKKDAQQVDVAGGVPESR